MQQQRERVTRTMWAFLLDWHKELEKKEIEISHLRLFNRGFWIIAPWLAQETHFFSILPFSFRTDRNHISPKANVTLNRIIHHLVLAFLALIFMPFCYVIHILMQLLPFKNNQIEPENFDLFNSIDFAPSYAQVEKRVPENSDWSSTQFCLPSFVTLERCDLAPL